MIIKMCVCEHFSCTVYIVLLAIFLIVILSILIGT